MRWPERRGTCVGLASRERNAAAAAAKAPREKEPGRVARKRLGSRSVRVGEREKMKTNYPRRPLGYVLLLLAQRLFS